MREDATLIVQFGSIFFIIVGRVSEDPCGSFEGTKTKRTRRTR